ncbi:MAG: hypothetical protein QW837_05565, partial [Conexivisphaerales archaeon]
MIEYKSSFKTVYVNPRVTSECPVCGDKLRDIEMRNLWRGLRQTGLTCHNPAATRLPLVRIALKDEYLCTGHEPKVAGAGLTEKVNAPNDGY